MSAVLTVLLSGMPAVHADKTDLARESYVERSEVDFELSLKDVTPSRQTATVRIYELAGAEPGEHVVLLFVDAKFFRRETVRLPGRHGLSLRGLEPGPHRVTVQVVDSTGRVGRVSRQVEASKPDQPVE
jgi:hypothetical protein